jgi:hypothetical protein
MSARKTSNNAPLFAMLVPVRAFSYSGSPGFAF